MKIRLDVPELQREFLVNAVEILKKEPKVTGITIGGSYIYGLMDEHSDLDFRIITDDPTLPHDYAERERIARSLGPLLASFTGEHVGEPRLVIALYGPSLLHVDLKFITLDTEEKRVEDPDILYDPTGEIQSLFDRTTARFPQPDPQWIEDRFWIWMHYVSTKLRRGELMDAWGGLGFILDKVLCPLAVMKSGNVAAGLRRVETRAPEYVEELRAICVPCEKQAMKEAYLRAVELYRRLRPDDVKPSNAETEAVKFLQDS